MTWRRCPTCGCSMELVSAVQARAIRKRAGMTLRDMASWALLHHTYLSKLENGRLPMSARASHLYERLSKRGPK